jgi:hypothetical protein
MQRKQERRLGYRGIVNHVENRKGPTNNMLDMKGMLAPGVTRQHTDAELQEPVWLQGG